MEGRGTRMAMAMFLRLPIRDVVLSLMGSEEGIEVVFIDEEEEEEEEYKTKKKKNQNKAKP